MLKTFKLLLVASILMVVAACSAKHKEVEPPKGMTYKAAEVLVRQCQDISNHEFQKLLAKHEVNIKKQISDHLYIVTWDDDDRKAGAVVHELVNTQMFCGVEKNKER